MSSTKDNIIIDFDKLGGPVYIGRDRGMAERIKYKLDEIDKTEQCVEVKIPDTIYSINSSFFLGLFGKSIKFAGSSKKFREKYLISAPDDVNDNLESYIERALYEKTLMSK